MIQKPLNEITIDDLNELVTNSVPEGRNLDYKRDLCGNGDSDKKEFLSDISSFANATGGDLLFGVDEADGVASAIVGLVGFDPDAAILRLESSIRDGIDPRIPGVQFKVIEGGTNGPVLIVRIPNSWASPHMVTFKNHSRFFSRGSAGKFQLDVAEIRSAFDATGLLSQRIAEWRTDRLGKILSGDGPFVLPRDSCLVAHIVPMNSFNDNKFSAEELGASGLDFFPLDSSGANRRTNIDGVVRYRPVDQIADQAKTYTQVFRSGCVEAVSTRLLTEKDDSRFIASIAYERDLVRSIESYIKSLSQLGVTPPLLFMVSLLGVKGAYMYVDPFRYGGFDQQSIDRDNLIIPEVLIEDMSCNVSITLRPAFDMIWNACGFARSFNYNEDGEWAPR